MTDKTRQGRSNRARGHSFERALVNLLKSYGYQASSARAASPEMDTLGVDIITNAPFNIQCKYVEALSPGPHDIIKGMPFIKGQVNILAHKRANRGTVISMSITDFCDLLLVQGPGLTEEELGLQ